MAAMLNLRQLPRAAFFVLAAAILVSACGNDCKHLANLICNCEATIAQQNRCHDAVSAANSNADLSHQQQDCCKSILEAGTCQCWRLREGDFAACGLTGDALTNPQFEFKCSQ
jgi:hypothetical protein